MARKPEMEGHTIMDTHESVWWNNSAKQQHYLTMHLFYFHNLVHTQAEARAEERQQNIIEGEFCSTTVKGFEWFASYTTKFVGGMNKV